MHSEIYRSLRYPILILRKYIQHFHCCLLKISLLEQHVLFLYYNNRVEVLSRQQKAIANNNYTAFDRNI